MNKKQLEQSPLKTAIISFQGTLSFSVNYSSLEELSNIVAFLNSPKEGLECIVKLSPKDAFRWDQDLHRSFFSKNEHLPLEYVMQQYSSAKAV